MNTARSAEFRYLWLELLVSSEEGLDDLEGDFGLRLDRLKEIRNQARRRYVNYLTLEGTNERWRLNRSQDKEQLQVSVAIGVHEDLKEALEA